MKKLLLFFGSLFLSVSVFAQPEGVIKEQPEGQLVMYSRSGQAIYSLWEMLIGEQDDVVKVVFANDGKKVYFQNILYNIDQYYEESWAVGTLSSDGTKITVPMGQQIGYDDYNMWNVTLAFGSTTVGDGQNVMDVQFVPNEDVKEVVFSVDPVTKKLTLENTQGDMYQGTMYQGWAATGIGAMMSNGQWAGYLSWNTVYTPMGEPVAAVPVAPRMMSFESATEWTGASVQFFVKPFDVNGNRLFDENFSYRLYTDDDQLYTFKKDNYQSEMAEEDIFAEGDRTEIPLSFSDYTNIISWNGTRVYFPQTLKGETVFNKRIGVQALYTVGGVTNASEITYMTICKVSGVVIDADGDPVPDVSVIVYRKPATNPAGVRFAVPDPIYLTTDIEGQFSTELPAGHEYFLSTYDAEWNTYDIGHFTLGDDDLNLGNIPLSGTDGIRQTVTDDNGKPVYYNLAGQKMNGTVLPAGLYIRNGKKVIIK